jgi:hypothetical protein
VLGCAADDGPLDLGHPLGHRQVCHVGESRWRSVAGTSVPSRGGCRQQASVQPMIVRRIPPGNRPDPPHDHETTESRRSAVGK